MAEKPISSPVRASFITIRAYSRRVEYATPSAGVSAWYKSRDVKKLKPTRRVLGVLFILKKGAMNTKQDILVRIKRKYSRS